MVKYQFTGINRSGKRVKGVMPAVNPLDLEQRLRASQIDLIQYKVQSKGLSLQRPKITMQDVITLTDELRMMIGAGIPLMEVIDDARQNFPSDPMRELLTSVYESMEGGDSFSQALTPYVNLFGDVYISLVRVGEQTGQLEEVLTDLEEMLSWQQALESKAKKIMIYPTIVFTVVIGVVILMMLFVVPQLLSFIKEMGGELGLATRALIATSEFVQNHIVGILVSPFILYFTLRAARRKFPKFQLWLDEKMLRIKLIGPIMHKIKLARMSNTLATMDRAGVGLIDALALSPKVVNNAFMEQQILTSQRLIQEGQQIHQAFLKSQLMPSMAVRIVKAGEDSGRLEEALRNVSKIYDKQAKDLIDKIEPAIEPILTVVMAVVVGWVMMAVLGPVYDTISKVQ